MVLLFLVLSPSAARYSSSFIRPPTTRGKAKARKYTFANFSIILKSKLNSYNFIWWHQFIQYFHATTTTFRIPMYKVGGQIARNYRRIVGEYVRVGRTRI